MVVNIVGGTLIGYFSHSGASQLDPSESVDRDHSFMARNIYRVLQ